MVDKGSSRTLHESKILPTLHQRSTLDCLYSVKRQSNLSLSLLLPSKIYPPGSLFTVLTSKRGHQYVRLSPVTNLLRDPSLIQLLIIVTGTQGLSKMKRNHIHLAQGVAGKDVVSGMSFFFPSCSSSNADLCCSNLTKACELPPRSLFSSICKKHSMQASNFFCQITGLYLPKVMMKAF